MIKRTAIVAVSMLASLAASLIWVPAAAADFPTKPITLLAPFAAGGTVDIVARIVGIRPGQELGQPVIVENRGGGGGTIGADLLARGTPDGHTLTVKDVMPLANIGMTPNVLVVTNSLPVKTLDEFLAYAKTNSVNYRSGGNGSPGHLPMEVL
jgi:tripartite-type tricarboxylate transporter receptor subunit TctC